MGRISGKRKPVVPQYAVFPLLSCVILNFIVYTGTDLLAGSWKHYDLTLPLDPGGSCYTGICYRLSGVLCVLDCELYINCTAGGRSLHPVCDSGYAVQAGMRIFLSCASHNQCQAGAVWQRDLGDASGNGVRGG